MTCHKYSSFLLSLFLDEELHSKGELEAHLEVCSFCRAWMENVKNRERQVHIQERHMENFVMIQAFDTTCQTRKSCRLQWEPVWANIVDDEFHFQDSHCEASLGFFLRYFWYGQVGVYVINCGFPLQTLLQRGKRYIAISLKKSERIIPSDGLFLMDLGYPVVKITVEIPKSFQENPISKKFKTLALGTESFISRFFRDVSMEPSEMQRWNEIKQAMSSRDLGIYLMNLNAKAGYKKIASCFRVPRGHVARLIERTRKRLIR